MTDLNTANEKSKILRDRARRLALAPQEIKIATDSLAVLEFALSNQRYALSTQYVVEVLSLKEFAPLPGTPSFIAGVINVRGEVLAVIDIKKVFNIPDVGITNLDQVIVIDIADMKFGILADNVLGSRMVPLQALQPTLSALSGVGAEYLKGITGDELIILDLEKIALDHRIVVFEQAGA